MSNYQTLKSGEDRRNGLLFSYFGPTNLENAFVILEEKHQVFFSQSVVVSLTTNVLYFVPV